MKIKSGKVSADIITAELKSIYEPVMCLRVCLCVTFVRVYVYVTNCSFFGLSLMLAGVVLDGNVRPSLPPSLPVNGGIINASARVNYARGVI